MDRKFPEDPEIQRLIQVSAASRRLLESSAVSLKSRLDVPARIRGSLKSHPSTWVAGSMFSGLAASLLFRRRPAKVKKPRGLSDILLGLTLTAARPMLKVWLANQAKHWIAGLTANPPISAAVTLPRQPRPCSSPSETSNSL